MRSSGDKWSDEFIHHCEADSPIYNLDILKILYLGGPLNSMLFISNWPWSVFLLWATDGQDIG